MSVWHTGTRQRINAFANGNPAGTRCAAMAWLGSHALLAIGSSDGCVRVWQGWGTPGWQQLRAAWNAVEVAREARERTAAERALSMAWQPQTGVLAVAGGGSARELQAIRYFDGFLGARIGPVTCLSWHPSRMLLAAGAADSVVSLWQQ